MAESDKDKTQTHLPLAAGTDISHYRIEKRLGAGGMGEVYLAEDTRLKRRVALKFLSPQLLATEESRARFVNEARVAAALDHPNICPVYEIEEVDNRTFIAMAYIDGATLAEKIKDRPLKLNEALDLALDIAHGLQEAHEKGIVHRDIKSSNVMITKKGRGKLTDFGLARLVDASGLTKTGTVMGTATFMSPEQVRGDKADHRSDIWSLGVVIYQMVTGVLPFRGDSSHAVSHQIVHENQEPLTAVRSNIPLSLERIVNKCLEKDTAKRYQHVDDLIVDLQGVTAVGDTSRSRTIPKAATAIAIVLALAAAFYFVSGYLTNGKPTFENPLAKATFSKLIDFEGADAAISPDGNFVAFVSDRDGQFDVWVAQVETGNVFNRTRGAAGDVRRLLQDVGFSADGSNIIVFGTPKRAIQAMPLLSGPLRTILRDSVIHADWSPDGGRVAYHTHSEGDPLFVADGDGTNSRMIIAANKGGHQHFATWSLDGKWIYIVRGLDNSWDMDLWRVSPDGGEQEQLTENLRDVTYPTPLDEKTVLFVARDNSGAGPWLWALDIANREFRRASIGLERYSSLNSDAAGNRLAATVVHPEAHLWIVPITDSVAGENDAALYPLPAVRAHNPTFTGNALYFLSSRGSGDGLWRFSDDTLVEVWSGSASPLFEVPAISSDGKSLVIMLRRNGKIGAYLINADGSNLRLLTGAIDVRGSASWSPDGKWLVVGGDDYNGPGLFKVSVVTGEYERIVDMRAVNPVWSPRGDIIIYSGPQVNAVMPLLAVRADGTAIELPDIHILALGHRYRFLPDGTGLVYMQGVRVSQDFWLLDFATRDVRQLTSLARGATMQSFDVSPDGKSIIFDRLRDNSEIVLIEIPQNDR